MIGDIKECAKYLNKTTKALEMLLYHDKKNKKETNVNGYSICRIE